MGEKIFEFIKELAIGKHSKKFWGIAILLLILILLIFPYIDANFLYYSRIEKRIDNLSSLAALNGKSIEDIPELLAEYNSIIEEINAAQTKSIGSAMSDSSNTDFEFWTKFISGGFLFVLIGIIGLFQKKKGEKYTFSFFMKNNFSVFIICMIFAIILAFIFSNIPIIGSVWINSVAAPVLQFIIVYLLFFQPKSK